jgi:hypothetical protein
MAVTSFGLLLYALALLAGAAREFGKWRACSPARPGDGGRPDGQAAS